MRLILSIILIFLFTSKFGYSQQIIEKCPNYRQNYTYFAQAIVQILTLITGKLTIMDLYLTIILKL